MPKEPRAYRDNLADILEYNENRRIVSQQTVSAYLGLNPKTVKKRYGIGREGISAPTLARLLSEGT